MIDTGNGSDRIALKAENESGIGFQAMGGGLGINAGSGNDRVDLIAENESGTGFQVTDNNFFANGEDGEDRITMVARNESGNGFVIMSGQVFPAMVLTGGSGEDRITIKAENDSGQGIVGIGDTTLFVAGNEDDDRVVIDSNNAGTISFERSTLNGGDGEDRLDNDHGNTATVIQIVTGFEIFG